LDSSTGGEPQDAAAEDALAEVAARLLAETAKASARVRVLAADLLRRRPRGDEEADPGESPEAE
jgi:hypothetical protein